MLITPSSSGVETITTKAHTPAIAEANTLLTIMHLKKTLISHPSLDVLISIRFLDTVSRISRNLKKIIKEKVNIRSYGTLPKL